jgi:hypothetical protein
MDILRIGDKVMWRGSWGFNSLHRHVRSFLEPQVATVVNISRDAHNKDGTPVDSIPWTEVKGRTVIIDLDNNHWAYGFQIYPIKET